MVNRIRVFTLLFVSLVGLQSWGNDLRDLAASMSVGQWAQLTTSGLTAAITDNYGSGSHNILTFSCGGPTWDDITERIFFIGADDPGDSQHFVIYDAATNTWSRTAAGPWMDTSAPTNNHSYTYQSIDRDNRFFRYKNRRYNIDTQTWIGNATDEPSSAGRAHSVWQYFPGIGYIEANDGTIRKLVSDDGSWSTIQSGLFNWGLHPFGLYNAGNNTMVFGGGDSGTNGTLYRLDSDETVTALGNAPVSHIGPNSDAAGAGGGLITFDPASGDLIHITPEGSLRSWDTITDTWSPSSSLPFTPMTNDIGNDGALFPITSYGVIVLIEHNGQSGSPDSRMWVYKHGTMGPRPNPPTSLDAQ